MTSTWGVACADATLTSCPSLEAAIVVSWDSSHRSVLCARNSTRAAAERVPVVHVRAPSSASERRVIGPCAESFCRNIHTALVVAWHGARSVSSDSVGVPASEREIALPPRRRASLIPHGWEVVRSALCRGPISNSKPPCSFRSADRAAHDRDGVPVSTRKVACLSQAGVLSPPKSNQLASPLVIESL